MQSSYYTLATTDFCPLAILDRSMSSDKMDLISQESYCGLKSLSEGLRPGQHLPKTASEPTDCYKNNCSFKCPDFSAVGSQLRIEKTQ